MPPLAEQPCIDCFSSVSFPRFSTVHDYVFASVVRHNESFVSTLAPFDDEPTRKAHEWLFVARELCFSTSPTATSDAAPDGAADAPYASAVNWSAVEGDSRHRWPAYVKCSPFVVLDDAAFERLRGTRRAAATGALLGLAPDDDACELLFTTHIATYWPESLVVPIWAVRASHAPSRVARPQPDRLAALVAPAPHAPSYTHMMQTAWSMARGLGRTHTFGAPLDLLFVPNRFESARGAAAVPRGTTLERLKHVGVHRLHRMQRGDTGARLRVGARTVRLEAVHWLGPPRAAAATAAAMCVARAVGGVGTVQADEPLGMRLSVDEQRAACDAVRAAAWRQAGVASARASTGRTAPLPRVLVVQRDAGGHAHRELAAPSVAFLDALLRGLAGQPAPCVRFDGVCRVGGLALDEQVRLHASLDVLITPHGAEESNVAYMRPYSTVLELKTQQYDWYSQSYMSGCLVRHQYVSTVDGVLAGAEEQATGVLVRRAALCERLFAVLAMCEPHARVVALCNTSTTQHVEAPFGV